MTEHGWSGPPAVVMGDTDLLRPLALAGVRCSVVPSPGDPAPHSRAVDHVIAPPEDWDDPSEFLDRLVTYGQEHTEPPVLFYEDDEHLLFVSRNRAWLTRTFRFVVATPEQVEALVDKVSFGALASELGLPVPPTTILSPVPGSRPPPDLPYPLVVKPRRRCAELWAPVTWAKAVPVSTRDELEALWPRLVAVGQPALAQVLVPGPESCVESYHCYVDARGATVAEFTGRKLRTRPRAYGHTTALEITSEHDVLAAGRAVVRALGLRGVSKTDFKRGPDGRLWLLEVNPRFSLWHHPAALAGVNVPALVYADLTERPRPAPVAARRPVRWCALDDVKAAREWGVPWSRWLPWVLRCQAKAVWSHNDPMPFVRLVWDKVARALRRSSPSPHPKRHD